ncbi:MAG: methyltransferase family protein [Alphaproteobacteria bacterium]
MVLLFLAVGWVLEVYLPTGTGLPLLLRLIAGWALIVGPIVFVAWLYFGFRRIGQDYDVRKVPTKLVTDGAFAYSRNPGYAAMVLSCIGFALAFDNLWALAAAVPSYVTIERLVIRREEALLEALFGETYRDYRARVRRWI